MPLILIAFLLATATDFETRVDQLFPTTRGPGASIVVLRNGQVVLTKAYGMADLDKGVPNTPATIFRLASVTKPFTATAVLQLIESGKLSLDDPLSKFIPDYPAAAEVRIIHLLRHTAGIPDFISPDEAKKLPLEFEPGSRISYSNTGYQFLGQIVEKVSGQPWGAYLHDHIFQPLAMKNSGYDRSRDLPGRATGYLLGNQGYAPIPPQDVANAYAAGGLYSTAEDMARWSQALDSGKLLRRDTLQRAWTPGTLSDGRTTVYGFGWTILTFRGIREIGHGGDITGFNTYVARYPDEKLTVVVLSNAGMRPAGPLPTAADLAHSIAAIYLGDRLQDLDSLPRVTITPATLNTYVGRYRLDAPEIVLQNMGREILITREGDHLMAEANGMKLPLDPKSSSVFQAQGSPAELTFIPEKEAPCRKLVITLLGLREYQALRVPE